MCEFGGKLVAWMDREMGESEAVDVERHLAACADCRERLAAYEQTSGAFDAYCEAFAAAETRQTSAWRWAGIGAGAIAAAAAIAALLIVPRIAHGPAHPVRPGTADSTRIAAQQAGPASMKEQNAERGRAAVQAGVVDEAAKAAPRIPKKAHRRDAVEDAAQKWRAAAPTAFPLGAEPPIEIAIPADAMFPPGAVPPGMSFTADLTIAADGSAERMRLHPQLVGFERRASEP